MYVDEAPTFIDSYTLVVLFQNGLKFFLVEHSYFSASLLSRDSFKTLIIQYYEQHFTAKTNGY